MLDLRSCTILDDFKVRDRTDFVLFNFKENSLLITVVYSVFFIIVLNENLYAPNMQSSLSVEFIVLL